MSLAWVIGFNKLASGLETHKEKIGVWILLGVTLVVLRYLAIKSDYFYFNLDEAFYRDKNGKDIREKK